MTGFRMVRRSSNRCTKAGSRRFRLRTFVWAALLLGSISTGRARAQPAQPAQPESTTQTPETATAAELAEEARKAHDLDHLDEAIDKYGRAYLISGDPNLLFNMAEAHREAGHDVDALRLFQSYLRRAPKGTHHDSATQQMNELEEKVRAEDQARATTPPPVAATASGAGASTSASEAPGADLTARSEPSKPRETPPMPRWIPWAAGVATVALATGAIVSGLSASSHFDDLKNSCGQTAAGCDAASISDVKSRASRANILWVLTGVAALGTGITVYINTSAAGVSGVWAF